MTLMVPRVLREVFDRVTPVVFFIVVASLSGLGFILATPPFQGTDESAHFLRAYQISEGNLVVDTNGGQIGGRLPSSIYKTFVLTTTHPVVSFNPNIKYNEHKTSAALGIPLDSKHESGYDMSGTALYSPLSYAGSATAILIGRLCGFSPVILLYGARLASLTCWILLIGLAIRCIPYRKWTLVFLGLLPMALFQAATLNVDAVTIGSVALLLAYLLKLRHENRALKKSQIVLVCAIVSMTLLSKQTMLVFLPLILLVPRRLFHTRTYYLAYLSIATVVPLLLLGVWSLLTRHIDLDTVYGSANGQNPSQQLSVILHQPFAYLQVLYNTVVNSTGDELARSMIGRFGWFDAPLPWVIVVAVYVLLALLIFGDDELTQKSKDWLGRNDKLLIGLVFILYWGAVYTSLYLYYSPVGFNFVYGLQGRYFLPLLFLLIPLFYGKLLFYKPGTTKTLAVYGSFFMLTASILTVVSRYYIVGAK